MKKLTLLTIALVSTTFICQAQISKGSKFLGGSIGFSSSKDESPGSNPTEVNNTGWSLRPQLGKAIADNKILGFFVNVSGSTYDSRNNADISENRNWGTGGGVFYRNYYPVGSRFFLFGEASLGLGADKEERRVNDKLNQKQTSTAVFASIVPGVSFAVSRKLHLEAALTNLLSLTYSTGSSEIYDITGGATIRTVHSKRFFASANTNGFNNIAIGLRWIMPSKK